MCEFKDCEFKRERKSEKYKLREGNKIVSQCLSLCMKRRRRRRRAYLRLIKV